MVSRVVWCAQMRSRAETGVHPYRGLPQREREKKRQFPASRIKPSQGTQTTQFRSGGSVAELERLVVASLGELSLHGSTILTRISIP